MSFSESIVVKNAAAANVTLQRLNGDSQKVTYIDVSSTLATPRNMFISHQMSSAQDGTDRHLVKLTKVALDANSRQCTATLNLTLNVPKLGIVRGDVDDLIAMVKEFLVTANVDKLIRGEV